MTNNRGMPTAPSDPGEDWARALAEMTSGSPEAAVSAAEPDKADADGASADRADSDRAEAAAAPSDAAAGDQAAEVQAVGDQAAGDQAAVLSGPELALGRRRRLALAAILGVATIVIGSVGIWAAVAAHGLRVSAADANRAFTDAAATRAVDRQVGAAVNTIFSYSYADSARTRTAAQGLLTGPAIRQYNQLFAIVEKEAPKEKLTVTTRVTNIGVELLTGDRARVLVFANQQDSSAGTGKTTYGGAMFAVTALNQSGKWKIESIDTFTGPA